MNSFDPMSVRQAVAEFTPRRPERFQELIAARDVIAELRQKRASYRAIAELLTQHCLPTSKTAIAAFCHHILGEVVRPRRRPGRKRPVVPAMSVGEGASPPTLAAPAPAEPAVNNATAELQPVRTRGPRIAQIRKLVPQIHEKTDSHS